MVADTPGPLGADDQREAGFVDSERRTSQLAPTPRQEVVRNQTDASKSSASKSSRDMLTAGCLSAGQIETEEWLLIDLGLLDDGAGTLLASIVTLHQDHVTDERIGQVRSRDEQPFGICPYECVSFEEPGLS
jgi:hypothetical protein